MKRVVVLVVLVALGAGGWLLLGKSGATKDSVPTYTVAKSAFVRHVTAEGNLRAVKATPVAAPHRAAGFGPMKIAWLAPDGKQREGRRGRRARSTRRSPRRS